MILECPSCHARYMVPIGLFASGGRKVRCARCRQEWHAALPTNVDVFIPLPEAGPRRMPIPEAGPASPAVSAPPSALGAAIANLPAVIERQSWKKIARRLGAGIVLAAALIAWPVLGRDPIIKAIPSLRGVYAAFGLYAHWSGHGLLFEQVKSDLKYDGGTMKLVVNGVIHNGTAEAQLIPDIKARALGPDQRIIQSWWISAPAATVESGGDVPFHSEVATPMQHTIENVSLEFDPLRREGNGSP